MCQPDENFHPAPAEVDEGVCSCSMPVLTLIRTQNALTWHILCLKVSTDITVDVNQTSVTSVSKCNVSYVNKWG